jgi:hypothetical protein
LRAGLFSWLGPPTCPYSPECVEGEFCELRLVRMLRSSPYSTMFGFPRLRALVAEHGEERTLGNLLLEELYSFVGEGWEQEDDITLLTLRRSPASKPNFLEHFCVYKLR